MGIAVADKSITVQWILQIDVVLLEEAPNLLKQIKRTINSDGQCAVECFLELLKSLVVRS